MKISLNAQIEELELTIRERKAENAKAARSRGDSERQLRLQRLEAGLETLRQGGRP